MTNLYNFINLMNLFKSFKNLNTKLKKKKKIWKTNLILYSLFNLLVFDYTKINSKMTLKINSVFELAFNSKFISQVKIINKNFNFLIFHNDFKT